MTTGSRVAENECFQLPGGIVLDEGRRLDRAVLRSLTGVEEEWLASNQHLPSAIRTTRILQSCLCSIEDRPITIELIRKLLVGDRDYLMLQLRRLTLGDDIHAIVSCPSCNGKIDVDFRTTEVPVAVRPQAEPLHTIKLSDRTVLFRLPTGDDQEQTLAMDGEEAVESLFRRCIVNDGGQAISPAEREAIIDEMERRSPLVDLELDLACPECQHSFSMPFDTTSYFFAEMGTSKKQLLREVHTLALYYHWSEAEILGLQRDRRRAYLDLLNESLRPD